jgi:hypothetical protein
MRDIERRIEVLEERWDLTQTPVFYAATTVADIPEGERKARTRWPGRRLIAVVTGIPVPEYRLVLALQ